MEQQAKQIYSKYKRNYWLIFGIFLAAIVLLSVFRLYLPAVAVFGIYVIFARRWSSRQYENHILSILFTELDGKKYKAVVSQDKNIKAQWEYLYACMYAGDYDEVVSFCTAALDRKVNESVKCVMYLHLAKAYFETDDRENLRRVCIEYRSLVEASQNREQLLSGSVNHIEMYERFLGGDYEGALSLNEDRYEPEGEYTAKLNNTCVRLYSALLLYRGGDIKQAKELFEQIAADCPNLAAADIAKRHLEYLSGETDTLCLPDIQEDENACNAMRDAYKRFMRNTRIKQCAIIVASLAAFFVVLFVSPKEGTEESTAALLNGVINI